MISLCSFMKAYVANDEPSVVYSGLFQLDTERRTSESLQSLLSSERKKVRLSTMYMKM